MLLLFSPGTLITEWDEGKAIWKQLLSDEKLLKRAAAMLVEIAEYYGFDGWFINIENSIEVTNPLNKFLVKYFSCTSGMFQPDDVESICLFLEWIRQGIRLKDSDMLRQKIVIWYDSVTIKGELKWQNALNENNT